MKYFSVKQWLFDFFTANMVWEPNRDKDAASTSPPPIPEDTPEGIAKANVRRSHQLVLRRYLERAYLRADQKELSDQLLTVACQHTLTSSTQIVISFDINSGVSREIRPVYVLPMSLLTVDVNPSWTQTLQIQFVLANTQNNDPCEKLLQMKPLGAS